MLVYVRKDPFVIRRLCLSRVVAIGYITHISFLLNNQNYRRPLPFSGMKPRGQENCTDAMCKLKRRVRFNPPVMNLSGSATLALSRAVEENNIDRHLFLSAVDFRESALSCCQVLSDGTSTRHWTVPRMHCCAGERAFLICRCG